MLNKTQFDALVQLMGAGRMSEPMQAALRDYFSSDAPPSQKEIAHQYGVSHGGLNQRITLARRNIRLAYMLCTGVDC